MAAMAVGPEKDRNDVTTDQARITAEAPALQSLRDALDGFFAAPQPEARRIFHGRGQCFAGLEHLTLDWYGPIVLISAWTEVADPEFLRAAVLAADRHHQVDTILLQHRDRAGSPCDILHGPANFHTEVRELGLGYEVRPGRRQNAGLFLDMRPLRQWLLAHSRDCRVLNLFAYTCSLSVAALAGGAAAVTNVDVSKTSIAWGERNHRLNRQDMDRVRIVPHNLFTSWGRIRQYGRYDLVIVDPPSRQKGSFDAERDYAAVLKKLPGLCNPGARVIAALNSPFLGTDFVLDQCRRALGEFTLLERIPAAPEFSESEPEKGLKIFVIRLP